MPVKLGFGGLTNFKEHIIPYLNSDIILLENNQLHQADVIYWIYGPGPDIFPFLAQWLNSNCKIIIHWVGSDVTYIKQRLNSKLPQQIIYNLLWKSLIAKKTKNGNLHQFTVASWLQDEMAQIGITTHVMPLSSIHKQLGHYVTSETIPQGDFLSYVPQRRFEFYGGNLIYKLARMIPDKTFTMVHSDLDSIGIDSIRNCPPNLKLLPKITDDAMISLYRSHKCYLRLTKHDGLSLSVLEALYHGLQVLWTCDYPHVKAVDLTNFDSLVRTAQGTVEDWQTNQAGHDFIMAEFSDQIMQHRMDVLVNPLLR